MAKKIAKIIFSKIEPIQNNEKIINIAPIPNNNKESFSEELSLESDKKDDNKPHNKFSKDNMRKRAKFLTIKIIKKLLNSTIEEIDILKQNFSQPKLFELKQDSMNLTKDYYLKLLNRTFREIFSSDIKQSIITSIESKDEDPLIGLGVLFEVMWNNSSEDEKLSILK